MAGNRTLKLSILADIDDLKKKLGQGEAEISGFGDKLGDFGKKAAAAFAVAAAAAAAYAGKLLVDGVKSAIEDEKAQAKLAATLENVTGATKAQISAVEQQITKLSLAYGITDDQLRPSFERLAIATGNVTKAQELQKIALDVAAGSGKSLETVSNALAKAYEGNTAALGRLGVGLSTNELKTMSFDEVTQALAKTFEGQATVQADTFQGKMARLTVAFDEAKESIGARLLPILTNLINYFLNNVGPAVTEIKNKLAPVTKAIEDNKDEFKALWDFVKTYLVPFITGAMKLAFSGMVSSLTTIINAVGKLINFFEDLYNKYKKVVDFIKNNPLSKWLGSINPFSNTGFSNAGFITDNTDSNLSDTSSFAFSRAPTGTTPTSTPTPQMQADLGPWQITIRGRTINVPYGLTYDQAVAHAERVVAGIERKEELMARTAELRAQIEGRQSGKTDTSGSLIINVNAPSAIDTEGFTRSVIDALNQSEFRTGSLGTLLV